MAKIKVTKSTKIISQEIDTKPAADNLTNSLMSWTDKITNFRPDKRSYIILIILGILLLAFYKKSLFVAAIVNGTPITNLELQLKLNDQFRTQTLNQLINERLILSEAAKHNAIPNNLDVDKKIADLESSVGGKETLDALLTQQGQTRSGLRKQVLVQLAITKLYDQEATVSADEVAKFIESNKQLLKATDSASQQKEAYDTVKNQKLSQIFSDKFQQLKQAANIKIF